MTELDSVDEATAEELLQEYDYPGEILTDLNFYHDGDQYQVELSVDEEQLHREIVKAGTLSSRYLKQLSRIGV